MNKKQAVIFFLTNLLLGSNIPTTLAETPTIPLTTDLAPSFEQEAAPPLTPQVTSQATHGFSTYGKLKYPADFTHFDYTNPTAPKVGTIRLAFLGTFDSLNPYIVKGVAPALIIHTHATLLEEAKDRAGESYAYVAQSIELAPDRSWVIFRLNPKAVFNNGDPITSDDVIWVFNTLRTQGLPMYRTYYKNVSKAEKLDDHTVKFTFNTTTNNELTQILGQLPILSKNYYEKHSFTETSLKPAPSSGPYEVESVASGHNIVLKRVKNWWGESLPSQKGRHNFDKIRRDYYLETNALFEGFKSGQYDLREENIAKNWATAYTFPAFEKGLVKREELKEGLSSGTIGLFFNTRRPVFSDVRVRKALTLLLNFPWINKHLFYGLYQRNTSYYPNSDYEAKGPPTPKELEILQPYQQQIFPEILTQTFTLPAPQNEEELRELQMQAQELLKEAGYEIKDTIMTNVKTRKALVFDAIIYDKALEKILLNFALSLKRLGIELRIRTLDTAAYQLRVDSLDFDMIFSGVAQSQSLGNEQRDFFGSEKADTPGTRNFAGIKNPVIDQLIERLIQSKDYPSLVNNAKALDRVLLWNYYMIPSWHSNVTRIAYWNRFSRPEIHPKYQPADISTWWFDREKDAQLSKTSPEKEAEHKQKPSLWSKFIGLFS